MLNSSELAEWPKTEKLYYTNNHVYCDVSAPSTGVTAPATTFRCFLYCTVCHCMNQIR